MVYGSKYMSEETNLNAFDWLDKNLDSRIILSPGLTSFFLNKVENPLNHCLALKDHPN